MRKWKCPLCGSIYLSESEQRPLVCQDCEPMLEIGGSGKEAIHAKRPADCAKDGANDADKDQSAVWWERRRLPKVTAIIALLVAVASVGFVAVRLTPLGSLFSQSPRLIVDETFGKSDPRERTFDAGGPWTLEWSVTTRDTICLSSVQVWDAQGRRVGVFGSPSGTQDFASAGEYRIVVYPSREDRVHLVARQR